MSGVDWGDAPTWVGASFAGAAFLAAGGLFWVESRRDARTDDDARQAQANMITAWYERHRNEVVLPKHYVVCLRNGSSPGLSRRLLMRSVSVK